jgi:hypothetical protein
MMMMNDRDYFFIRDYVDYRCGGFNPADWPYRGGAKHAETISLRFGRCVADYCKTLSIPLGKARYVDPVTGYRTGLMSVVPEHLRPLVDGLWYEWVKKHREYFGGRA